MFWIPICFLVFIFWAISTSYNKIGAAAQRRQAAEQQNITQAFVAQVTDKKLEWETAKELEDNAIKRHNIVQEFMGGDPAWRDFYFTHNAAQHVLMAKQGKIPVWEAEYGYSGGTSTNLPPWQMNEMRERFLLAIEQELRSHRVRTAIVAQFNTDATASPIGAFESLRSHVERCGYGDTIWATRFCWAQTVPGGEYMI